MILATLQNGEPGWAGVAVAVRALHYAGTLGAAGLAFFALLFGSAQDAADAARLRRWTTGAALLGGVAGLVGLGVQVGFLGGAEGLADTEIWSVVLASRTGQSFGAASVGLPLLALLGRGPRWEPLAAAGGVLACASFALVGHTTQLTPRWAFAALLSIHLLVVAFWLGSLPPLAWAARHDGLRAAGLVERWSRVAMPAVAGLIVAGLVLAWSILGNAGQLFASWYGWTLIAKVVLVGGLLGLAALHRWRLTPALANNVPRAGRQLSRSIMVEAVVGLATLYIAAELVSTAPNPGISVR